MDTRGNRRISVTDPRNVVRPSVTAAPPPRRLTQINMFSKEEKATDKLKSHGDMARHKSENKSNFSTTKLTIIKRDSTIEKSKESTTKPTTTSAKAAEHKSAHKDSSTSSKQSSTAAIAAKTGEKPTQHHRKRHCSRDSPSSNSRDADSRLCVSVGPPKKSQKITEHHTIATATVSDDRHQRHRRDTYHENLKSRDNNKVERRKTICEHRAVGSAESKHSKELISPRRKTICASDANKLAKSASTAAQYSHSSSHRSKDAKRSRNDGRNRKKSPSHSRHSVGREFKHKLDRSRSGSRKSDVNDGDSECHYRSRKSSHSYSRSSSRNSTVSNEREHFRSRIKTEHRSDSRNDLNIDSTTPAASSTKVKVEPLEDAGLMLRPTSACSSASSDRLKLSKPKLSHNVVLSVAKESLPLNPPMVSIRQRIKAEPQDPYCIGFDEQNGAVAAVAAPATNVQLANQQQHSIDITKLMLPTMQNRRQSHIEPTPERKRYFSTSEADNQSEKGRVARMRAKSLPSCVRASIEDQYGRTHYGQLQRYYSDLRQNQKAFSDITNYCSRHHRDSMGSNEYLVGYNDLTGAPEMLYSKLDPLLTASQENHETMDYEEDTVFAERRPNASLIFPVPSVEETKQEAVLHTCNVEDIPLPPTPPPLEIATSDEARPSSTRNAEIEAVTESSESSMLPQYDELSQQSMPLSPSQYTNISDPAEALKYSSQHGGIVKLPIESSTIARQPTKEPLPDMPPAEIVAKAASPSITKATAAVTEQNNVNDVGDADVPKVPINAAESAVAAATATEVVVPLEDGAAKIDNDAENKHHDVAAGCEVGSIAAAVELPLYKQHSSSRTENSIDEETSTIPLSELLTDHESSTSSSINEKRPNKSSSTKKKKRGHDSGIRSNHQKRAPSRSKREPPPMHIVGDDDDDCGSSQQLKKGTITVMTPQRSTPTPPVAATHAAGKRTLSAKDEFYRKPFQYGWRRELVWRSNMDSNSSKADVYFISPAGRKLRSRNDIMPLLEGDLTIDNFCFIREPQDVSAEFELVRHAKSANRNSLAAVPQAALATPPPMGKRISKPKAPKGASPPPEGWTPVQALKNSMAGSSLSKTKSANNSYRSDMHAGVNAQTLPAAAVKDQKRRSRASSTRSQAHEACSVACTRAKGHVPQLKCTRCQLMFHNECVAMERNENVGQRQREFVCEACHAKWPGAAKEPSNTAAKARSSTLLQPLAAVGQSQAISDASVSAVAAQLPQEIMVINGKKYISIARPPVESAVPSIVLPQSEELQKMRHRFNLKTPALVSAATSPISTQLQQVTATPTGHDASSFSNQSTCQHVRVSPLRNYLGDMTSGYGVFVNVLQYLKVQDRAKFANVCRMFNVISRDANLWQIVRLKNSRISDWASFARTLRRHETKHLDMRKMLMPGHQRNDEMWSQFMENIGSVDTLRTIDVCRCSASIVEQLFGSIAHLRVLNALAINDDQLCLEQLCRLQQLHELRLRSTSESCTLEGDLNALGQLKQLTHLSLTGLTNLADKSIDVLAELTELRTLELGDCSVMDAKAFSEHILPSLRQLQRLRLENGNKADCNANDILDGVDACKSLRQLELINFDIKPGFDTKLAAACCTHIRRLLIIPTYLVQSATTNHIILNAMQQLQPEHALEVFTWGFTIEILRVTALYMDHKNDDNKTELIPVLRPIPGDLHSTADGPCEDPQIAIISLKRIEEIINARLPNVKFTTLKTYYSATCKQQLVST